MDCQLCGELMVLTSALFKGHLSLPRQGGEVEPRTGWVSFLWEVVGYGHAERCPWRVKESIV